MDSTSSFIAIKDASGNYTGIYCNWDSFPENVGYILFEFYQHLQKIKDLIALGSISELGVNPNNKYQHIDSEFIDTTISFDNPGSQFSTDSYETLIEECNKIFVSYLYVFDEVKAMWYMAFVCAGDTELEPLTQDLVGL